MRHSHLDKSRLTPLRRTMVVLPALLAIAGWTAFLLFSDGFWSGVALVGIAMSLLAGWVALRPLARRSSQYLALIGLALLVWGLLTALAGLLLSTAGLTLSGALVFVVAGYLSLWRMRAEPGVPEPSLSFLQALNVALDEWVLGYFTGTISVPNVPRRERIVHESRQALEYFAQQGWLEHPASFHQPPGAPEQVERKARRFGRHRYEGLRFVSGYQAPVGAPGAARWQALEQSPLAYTRILRHQDPGRPWLVCVHGYRMGPRWMDFSLFSPGWLHHKLGFNIAMPLLPLHGPRKAGWRSGDRYLDGDLLDIVYTQAQALWDLRRLLAWLRIHEGADRISVLGYSLGGYNAALLSSLDKRLDAVIAAIPLVDIAGVLWEHGPPSLLRHIQAAGVGPHEVRRLLRVVSPLALQSQLPVDRRFILAGRADRVVPLPPMLDLWRHWDKPALEWFDGTHLSVRREPDVPRKIEGFLELAGVLPRVAEPLRGHS